MVNISSTEKEVSKEKKHLTNSFDEEDTFTWTVSDTQVKMNEEDSKTATGSLDLILQKLGKLDLIETKLSVLDEMQNTVKDIKDDIQEFKLSLENTQQELAEACEKIDDLQAEAKTTTDKNALLQS